MVRVLWAVATVTLVAMAAILVELAVLLGHALANL